MKISKMYEFWLKIIKMGALPSGNALFSLSLERICSILQKVELRNECSYDIIQMSEKSDVKGKIENDAK